MDTGSGMVERLSYGADPNQMGELRLPAGKGPFPVAIVIHGGFWRAKYDLEHIVPLTAAFNEAGIATWSLEYRRIGQPGGGWPGTMQDVAAGADYLREIALRHPLQLDRVAAIGHSAGGHLALWLGARSKFPTNSLFFAKQPLTLRGIVALAPVADLRTAYELGLSETVVGSFLGGAPDDYPERYAQTSPIEMAPLGIETRVVHGTLDDIVPINIGEAYVAAAKAKGDDVAMVRLEGAGHFEVIEPKAKEYQQVLGTLKAVLGVDGP